MTVAATTPAGASSAAANANANANNAYEQLATDSIAQASKMPLAAAVEHLFSAEKVTRLHLDITSTTRLCLEIVRRCKSENDLNMLNEQIGVISKRRAQFKETVAEVVREVMKYLDEISNERLLEPLISTLKNVCEGKIHVELERASLTKRLSHLKEAQGDIDAAAEIIQEIAIETVGSMEKTAKIEFILEQMRLVLKKKDFVRAGLISKKISPKSLEDQPDALKVRYYESLLDVLRDREEHLEMAKAYYEMYKTDLMQGNASVRQDMLRKMVSSLCLAKYDNHQADMSNRLLQDRNLADDAPELKALLESFLGKELLDLQQVLRVVPAELIKKRVMEHNMRIISSYYSRISLRRFAQLLVAGEADAEQALCEMIVSKELDARIDRFEGIVSFYGGNGQGESSTQKLDRWSERIGEVLGLVDKATHLIHKEMMVHAQAAAAAGMAKSS